jgi:protein phosphatase PTC1
VNGVLSVARAMGDFELAAFITCDPDVFRLQTEKLTDNFFIVACDGLWDVVDDKVV